jgi:hypothetical protein
MHSVVLPDLDLSDFLVSCSPISLTTPSRASQATIGIHATSRSGTDAELQPSAEPNVFDLWTVAATSEIQPADLVLASNDLDVQAGGAHPVSSLDRPSSIPSCHCRSAPPCQAPFPWIATWCKCSCDHSTLASLQSSQSLEMPPYEIILVIFEHYFVHLNTSIPCVSEWDVFRSLHEQSLDKPGQQWQMSLALLNAVLFAGSGVGCLRYGSQVIQS